MEPEEVDMLLNCTHKPNLVCNMISTIIRAGKLTNQEIFNMDQNLTLFSDTTGGSERIFKTPIPLSWTSEQWILFQIVSGYTMRCSTLKGEEELSNLKI